MMKRAFPSAFLALAAFAVSSCASKDDSGSSGQFSQTASMAAEKTGAGLGEAALSPLEDLNLRRDEIPPLLKDETSPYGIQPQITASCETIAVEIAKLDAILGIDYDTPLPDEENLTDAEKAERRAAQVSDATLGYLSDEARGFIPFRGTVRWATGASRHERALNRALAIGTQRRAYLKGVGQGMGCEPPAAPHPTAPPAPRIVFMGDTPDAESQHAPGGGTNR